VPSSGFRNAGIRRSLHLGHFSKLQLALGVLKGKSDADFNASCDSAGKQWVLRFVPQGIATHSLPLNANFSFRVFPRNGTAPASPADDKTDGKASTSPADDKRSLPRLQTTRPTTRRLRTHRSSSNTPKCSCNSSEQQKEQTVSS